MFKPRKITITETDYKLIRLGNSYAAKAGYPVAAGGTGHNKAVITGASLSTTPLLGVIASIAGAKGNVLELDGVTAGSGNETTPVYYAYIIPSYLPIEYYIDLDAVAGTTTGSDGMCYLNTSATEGKLTESSVAFIAGTQGVVWSWGPDTTYDPTSFTVVGVISRHV